MSFADSLLLFALCLQFHNFGVIWMAQRVVYPLFAKVGPGEYVSYHRFYAQRIPLPVILPGFLSMVVPIAVLFWLPAAVPVWMAWANVACGAITFLVTVGLEIPRHNRLERDGKNDRIIAELVVFNWPRTVSITGSAGLTLAMTTRAFASV